MTTSGSLVTLLAAIGALVGKDRVVELIGTARIPLIVTLTAFAVGALCGLLGSRTRRYRVTSVEPLGAMRTGHWKDDEVDARNFLALAKIRTLESYRRGNRVKANWLLGGLSSQVIALIFLCFTIALSLA